MLIKYFLILITILSFGRPSMGCCDSLPVIEEGPQSIIISIPKSGTHQLCKCLNLMLNRPYMDTIILERELSPPHPESFYHLTIPILKKMIEVAHQKIWITHLMHQEDYASVLIETGSPFFFCYRDPRDLVVSLARYMQKYPAVWCDASFAALDEIIMDLIETGSLSNNHPPACGIKDLYLKYLSWLDVPGCHPVRFENLVGSQGGGSDQLQQLEIRKIAAHIGIIMSKEQAKAIGDLLFGGTATFKDSQLIAGSDHAGQINSWKRVFNEAHKQAFKECAGQLLIDLGYEKDFDW